MDRTSGINPFENNFFANTFTGWKLFRPSREKTCFFALCKENKSASQPVQPRSLIGAFVIF